MEYIAGVFTGFGLFYLLIFGVADPDKKWHGIIIEQGHGEYNGTTGEFQFLPSCNE